jgi:hypothetical protein
VPRNHLGGLPLWLQRHIPLNHHLDVLNSPNPGLRDAESSNH